MHDADESELLASLQASVGCCIPTPAMATSCAHRQRPRPSGRPWLMLVSLGWALQRQRGKTDWHLYGVNNPTACVLGAVDTLTESVWTKALHRGARRTGASFMGASQSTVGGTDQPSEQFSQPQKAPKEARPPINSARFHKDGRELAVR